LGFNLGLPNSAIVPVAMVFTILIMEHAITFVAPLWERWLFNGGDRDSMEILQTLEERLLTTGDLRQFLEAVLAAVVDRVQVDQAFVAALSSQGVDFVVTIGGDNPLENEDLPTNLLQVAAQNGLSENLFSSGDYWFIPLLDQESNSGELLGLLGVIHNPGQELDPEQIEALSILTERAVMALQDRKHQQQVFSSLEALSPQVSAIQRLRAAARYDGTDILTTPEIPLEERKLSQWVKDALTHYWGGPKLTESPLMGLSVVQQAIQENEGNPTNALRAILRKAIEYTRPEGERRFTADWILYNILEMKFMEGRKVREIAMRLAMSEADLYRKQRVAIEAVANAIVEMEQEALQEVSQTTTEVES